MLCLGLDSGTTTCKGLVLEVNSGKALAQASAPHSFIEGLPRGHVEQDPQTWCDAADRVIQSCLEKIGERRNEIVAFGVSGQQHGLVTLDHRNQPVRPAKLWCDTSTAPEAEKLNRALGNVDELIRRSGNAMVPGYTAPKILWLKENEPKNFTHTRTILLPHDFLNFWLTGERQMEYGDASGTGLLDVQSRTWCEPLAEFIDKGLLAKFPPLRSSTRPAGLLRSTLREKFQLGDILVSAGGGDNLLGAIGTGNIATGRLSMSLGTSGTLYAFTETPMIDPRGEISAFCDSTDHWLARISRIRGAHPMACASRSSSKTVHPLSSSSSPTPTIRICVKTRLGVQIVPADTAAHPKNTQPLTPTSPNFPQTAEISPCRMIARGSGASFANARCVRDH